MHTYAPTFSKNTVWRFLPPVLALCLFLVPLIGMQFTQEIQWTAFDFLVFGVMLAFVCGLYELSFRVRRDPLYLFGVAIFVGASFLLVWINLAVGIIGNENNPSNLLFFGAALMAVLGSIVVRIKPTGMKRLAFMMAGIQLTLGAFFFDEPLIPQFTLLFAALWGLAACFFARSLQKNTLES